jgi:hypothetical protein
VIELAWRPFLDPIGAHAYWWALIVPLAFLTSMAYKAVRHPTMARYWRSVVRMTVEILVSLLLLGVAAFAFVEYVIPAIAA